MLLAGTVEALTATAIVGGPLVVVVGGPLVEVVGGLVVVVLGGLVVVGELVGELVVVGGTFVVVDGTLMVVGGLVVVPKSISDDGCSRYRPAATHLQQRSEASGTRPSRRWFHRRCPNRPPIPHLYYLPLSPIHTSILVS